jgi:UDP:flavonoid glycosyltransferase YjiC (YdhE family)
MARIAVVSVGSRGDLFPMLGIGRELRRRGHAVTVLDQGEYGPEVTRTGLPFRPLGVRGSCQDAFERAGGTAQLLARMIRRVILPNILDWVDDIRQAGPFDAVVAHHFQFAAQLAAEVLDVPFVSVAGTDIAELYYPTAGSTQWDEATAQRRVRAIDRLGTEPLNAVRRRLGLAERPYACTIGTLSASGVVIVCPGPFLPPMHAWPEHFRIAGYPPYDGSDNSPLPGDVAQLVARQHLGPLVICSLGDAWARDYPLTCVHLAEIAARRGYRILYLLCRGRIEVTGRRIVTAEFVLLSRVLPYAGVLIHSAGRGSLVNGIRMAVPSLMIPQWLDCHENARKAAALGIGRVIGRQLEIGDMDAELAEVLGNPRYVEQTRAVAAAMTRDPDPGKVVEELILNALGSGSAR